ncbi:MAG: hypothetical protein CR994_03640 [Maribacter sp.]|nr:MAG: hypothetical protein CR994_03640 [Maribacter sp.]
MATAPTCTNVTTPTNGATDVSISTNIGWDIVANADDYLLTIGTSSGGNDITSTTVTGTTYDIPTNLAENTVYYVTVIPQNSTGQATGCTEISFTTETLATDPTCTNVTSPANGATDVSVSTNIGWDIIANADDYLLTIGITSGGNDIANTTVTGTTYDIPTDLAENTVYYVTVIPQNSTGQATGCTEISFTTETLSTAPTCTNVTSPANGATDVSVSTNIGWDIVANADDYLLTIGITSGGNNITNTTVTGTTYDIPTDLTENTTYYVSVIPQNAVGQATGCAEISFTTETIATVPTCTNVTTPTNGATDISISTNIVWDAVANADDYLLTIGTTSGANDITDTTVTGTTYDIPTDLNQNTTYYVSVIPQNSTGQATGCTEISFTTKEPVFFVDETKYGFSPDGDGVNETWKIVGIEQYPNNTVSIFNRWGDLVFQVNNYDNINNVFRGKANRLTGLGADELPEGTYFFNIAIQGTHNLRKTKGFLVLKR